MALTSPFDNNAIYARFKLDLQTILFAAGDTSESAPESINLFARMVFQHIQALLLLAQDAVPGTLSEQSLWAGLAREDEKACLREGLPLGKSFAGKLCHRSQYMVQAQKDIRDLLRFDLGRGEEESVYRLWKVPPPVMPVHSRDSMVRQTERAAPATCRYT